MWPLVGRGIQHIRIRVNRDALLPYGAGLDVNREPYGAGIDEVGSVDALSLIHI